MITIKDLTVSYKNKEGTVKALEKLNLNLEEGEIHVIIGPSGCGKSTLLNVLSGIIRDYTGEAAIDGHKVDPALMRIGLVQQSYGLLPWRSLYDNALLGLKIKDKKVDNEDYAREILAVLSLLEHSSKYPSELSGGQKQRTALARAFILKPELLLMDEPFSALDALTREELQELFLSLWKGHRVTTLFITHSVEEAISLGERISIMSKAPGRIIKTLVNPCFNMENLRYREEFYEMELHIRKVIKEEWSKNEG